jgi:hypothetical protein
LLGSKHGTRPPAENGLELRPDGREYRRGTGALHVVIDTAIDEAKGVAGEYRLIVTLAEEVGVEKGGEERVLEGKRAEDDTREDDELSISNHPHGTVVVGWRET